RWPPSAHRGGWKPYSFSRLERVALRLAREQFFRSGQSLRWCQLAIPCKDLPWFWFENFGIFDTRQVGNRLEFRGHRNPLWVFCDDHWLGRELVTGHSETVFGSYQQGEESVQSTADFFQCGVKVIAFFFHLVGNETSCDFGVVIRVEFNAFVFEITTNGGMVRE